MSASEHQDAGTVPDACNRAGLAPLMRETRGREELVIGMIDGPISVDHPYLAGARFRRLNPPPPQDAPSPAALRHGTFVAGILCARRGTAAPAICPGCTFAHAVIFGGAQGQGPLPTAAPGLLVEALVSCVDAGAEVVNLSLAAEPSPNTDRDLHDALSYAMARGVVVVAAAGNDGTLGGTTITRHPGVIPVSALASDGRPLASSNLGRSIGRNGIAAPGERIASVDPEGGLVSWTGTSAATPFVTGALALLRSLLPSIPVTRAAIALRHSTVPRRRSILPVGLDAHSAFVLLKHSEARR